eukprot:5465794-Pyramimonas_sp.AAC.1
MAARGAKRPGAAVDGDRPMQANAGGGSQGAGPQEGAAFGRGGKTNNNLEELAELTARLALITAREQALLEGCVLEGHLAPELRFLSGAGIEANRFYTDAVASLKEEKETDETVDLGKMAPPFAIAFSIVAAAARKAARGAAVETAANFWEAH